MINFIVGQRDSGKSTSFSQLYREAGAKDTALFSTKILNNVGDIEGYDLLMMPDDIKLPLARLRDSDNTFSEYDSLFKGRFIFSISAFIAGNDYILNKLTPHVWIDEVGRLELEEKGYAQLIRTLLSRSIELTIAIRDIYLHEFIDRYSITNYRII